MHPFEVVRRPVVTEKNTRLAAQNKYMFEVAPTATKIQIKEAIERAFGVQVKAVNVMNVRGKLRRVGRSRGMTSPWRKAIVTLQPGHKIEIFEGV